MGGAAGVGVMVLGRFFVKQVPELVFAEFGQFWNQINAGQLRHFGALRGSEQNVFTIGTPVDIAAGSVGQKADDWFGLAPGCRYDPHIAEIYLVP